MYMRRVDGENAECSVHPHIGEIEFVLGSVGNPAVVVNARGCSAQHHSPEVVKDRTRHSIAAAAALGREAVSSAAIGLAVGGSFEQYCALPYPLVIDCRSRSVLAEHPPFAGSLD